MTLDTRSAQLVHRAIRRGDYLRRPRCRLSDVDGHKEWLHFCVSSARLDLLVNFSVVDDTRGGASEGDEIARLTCAVRTGASWDGDVEAFEAQDVVARGGRFEIGFGDNFAAYGAGLYRVVARLRHRPIELDLTFYPVTIASQVNNIALGDGPPFQWFVVPRLLASGVVRVGGEEHELVDVPAYHDHNWGYFRWGQDFSWVWGYGHGRDPHAPWSFAFDRLSDRGKRRDLLRGLLLWKGPRHFRLFSAREIELRYEGRLRPKTMLDLPRIMALLGPEVIADIPERLHIVASSRGDTVRATLSFDAVCRLHAPNDDDLGTTRIHEVSADVAVEGRVRDESVEFNGRAMFEFLGG